MSLPSWDSDAWPTYIFICEVPCPCLLLYRFVCSLACSIRSRTGSAVTRCQRRSPFPPSLFRKPISIRYCWVAVISALQHILSLQRLQMSHNVLPCSVNRFQGCIHWDWLCGEPPPSGFVEILALPQHGHPQTACSYVYKYMSNTYAHISSLIGSFWGY